MSKKVLAVLCCVFLLAPVLAAGALDGADFSGSWKLNPGKSEMGGGGRGAGPGGGGGGRRVGDGGAGGGGRRGGGMGGATEFTVSQDGNMLNIDEGGNPYSIEIGGDATSVDSPRGAMTVEAKWEGSKLVVQRVTERTTPQGAMKIKESQIWEISEDGKTLTQEVEMNTPRGTQNRKMVFDKQ